MTGKKTDPAARPTDDLTFAICGVCGGEHDNGFGYAPSGYDKPILWACTECLPIAPHVYGVVRVKGSFYSQAARDKAGEAGGAYLDKIGKTDMAEMTLEEWREFLDIVLRESRDELRRLYAGHVAPF